MPSNEMLLMGDEDDFLIFQMRTQDIHSLASFIIIFTGYISTVREQVVKIKVFHNMEPVNSTQLKLSDLHSTNGPLPTNFCRYPSCPSKDFADLSPQGLFGVQLLVGEPFCLNFCWSNSVSLALPSVLLSFL